MTRGFSAKAAAMNAMDDTVGTIEVGKEADLIVVDGNPVDDLEALASVQMTFVKGSLMYARGPLS